MASEAQQREQRREAVAKEQQKADLDAALAAAPSEEEQQRLQARIAPAERDEEHQFVEAEYAHTDPELVQPNLTNTSMAEVERDYLADSGKPVELTRPDRAESTYDVPRGEITAERLERMTDEQVKESGILKNPVGLVHPARLSPSSERERTPYQRSPAAGPGTWPVPEDALPAAMPSDPPVEDRDADGPGDNTFSGVTGFVKGKDGGLSVQPQKGKSVKINKADMRMASALYSSLRQQFPHFTTEQLNDEFLIAWEARVGGAQSHREPQGLSQHGLTAVGDDRATFVDLGSQRQTDAAFEADPAPPAPAVTGTGLPSTNEPSSRAPDAAKEPTGETTAADQQAAAAIAKFDHDGDGRPGGAPAGGNKRK